MGEALGTNASWKLEYVALERDPVLQFTYPAGLESDGYGYIKPHVILELGARSDHTPANIANITPYVAEAFPGQFGRPSCLVKTLNPERTFWEKVLILHKENHRSADKDYPPHLSRHYYDVVRIAGSAAVQKATLDTQLRDQVVDHYNVFFPTAWANYGIVKHGGLTLVPNDRLTAALRGDFKNMQTMFFDDENPEFEVVIDALPSLEEILNDL
jgi:hypothetical protein